ncbi:WPP domain-associated protein [Telopea speciosissima]|uniref:WPP domain-associated protein n=1 Tax=Telopea speciosissima TaxID=54955 RepID=UPI001CC77A77|nr:WPP domain-associated protein [Telopea speciosissima]XP_043701945.1 WPP domain-associated protein [Telopea speciosissima]
MESSEVLDASGLRSVEVTSPSDGLMQPDISFKEGENLGSDILDDLESYLEDIDDSLTISRMVSDSVIKGMVNAVIEDSAEKIALKELEVQTLNERLQFYEADADKVKELRLSTVGMDNDRSQFKLQSSFLGTHVQRGRTEVCFGNLRGAAEEQFQRLQKDMNDLKECKLVGKTMLGVGTQRVGGHIQGNVEDKWEEVDKTLNLLRSIVNTVLDQVDDVVYLSKTSHSEWQQEQEFQEEIEAMVIQNSIKSLQEELKIEVCIGENIKQLVNEISSLRQELDFISKSLFSSESGYLPCHGSHESAEEWNASSKDNINQKASNHISLPSSLQKENGKLEPKSSSLDRMDSAELKHRSIDELIIFFQGEMAIMKRNHESMLQEKTEAYFSLRREFLKERGPLSLRRDKVFDSLKKKIPEVILKLDGLLKEKKELPVSYEDSMSIRFLKDRLDALHSENRLLKDLLANKREEVKCLSSQVSDATDKMSHHSLMEVDLLEETRKLNCVMEDFKMDVSVREEINICILRDVVRKFKCDVEDSDTKFRVMQDICKIIFRESIKDAEAMMEWGITDSDMEYIIMQEVCGTIHREAVKNAQAAINLIKAEYEKENGKIVCLEATFLETKKALSLETEEKEQLKQDKLSLLTVVAEKEKLAEEIESAMIKEKKCYELVCQEIDQLKDHVNQQERLISESNKESDTTKSKFEEALKRIGQYKGEISKLDQNLKLAMEKLSLAEGERRDLHAAIQEKQATISLLNSKEREQRKEMKCIMISIEGLSKAVADFECRLTKNVEQNSLRLEKLTSQFLPLVQKATVLKRTGLVYKQKLERKYSDLQKAESEVDLLGDEVDGLLNLLEKIYIALDHYSPILRHYPGIMEILKLVRRELSGETVKLS